MSPLDDPTSCFETRVCLFLLVFQSARFHVRLIVTSAKELADVLGIVAFIEADMLMARGRLRAGDCNAIESGPEQFDVVGVGTADRDSQRNAAGVSEYRTLGSQFATIGRIFASIFPHPEAICSSLRQRFAKFHAMPLSLSYFRRDAVRIANSRVSSSEFSRPVRQRLIRALRTPGASRQLRKQVNDAYDTSTDVRYAAARLWIDGIVQTADTRDVLIQSLSIVTRHAGTEPFRTGVYQV